MTARGPWYSDPALVWYLISQRLPSTATSVALPVLNLALSNPTVWQDTICVLSIRVKRGWSEQLLASAFGFGGAAWTGTTGAVRRAAARRKTDGWRFTTRHSSRPLWNGSAGSAWAVTAGPASTARKTWKDGISSARRQQRVITGSGIAGDALAVEQQQRNALAA